MNDKPTRTGSPVSDLVHTFQRVWRLMRDPRVPLALKLIPFGALIYVISPLDLVPDVVPFFGQLDDVAILLLAMRAFLELVPKDLVADAGAAPSAETVDATSRVVDE